MLALPYLTPEDAALFCTDLFTAFRSDENNGDAYHPFTRDSLSLILKRVDKVCSSRVTPRMLMETLSRVLTEIYEAQPADRGIRLPLREDIIESTLSGIGDDR